MHDVLSNLWLFAQAIAKVLIMTGLGLGFALVIAAEFLQARQAERNRHESRGHLFLVPRTERSRVRPKGLLLELRPSRRRPARPVRLPEMPAQ